MNVYLKALTYQDGRSLQIVIRDGPCVVQQLLATATVEHVLNHAPGRNSDAAFQSVDGVTRGAELHRARGAVLFSVRVTCRV